MDDNWCVVCERHFDDIESTLYGSEACRNADLPAELEIITTMNTDKVNIIMSDDASFSSVAISNSSIVIASSVLPLKNTTGFITTPNFCAHRRARSLTNRLPLPDLRYFGVMPMTVPVRTTRPSVELHSSDLHHTLTSHAIDDNDDYDHSDLLSTSSKSASVPISTSMMSIANSKRHGSRSIYRNDDSGFATAESSPFLSEDDDNDNDVNNNESILQSGVIHDSNTNAQPKQQEKLPRNACYGRNGSSARRHYVSRFCHSSNDDHMNMLSCFSTTDTCWPAPHYSINDTLATGSDLMPFDNINHLNLAKNSFGLPGIGVYHN